MINIFYSKKLNNLRICTIVEDHWTSHAHKAEKEKFTIRYLWFRIKSAWKTKPTEQNQTQTNCRVKERTACVFVVVLFLLKSVFEQFEFFKCSLLMNKFKEKNQMNHSADSMTFCGKWWRDQTKPRKKNW